MPTLRSMTQNEFEAWAKQSKVSYAEAKMRANGFTQEEASKIAEQSFSHLLPDGVGTKNQFLYVLEQQEKNLGYFWFALQGVAHNQKAFIYDVKIYDEYQGQGYGRLIMQLGEQKAKETGAKRIASHVFSYNERAIKLYQSLNYLTTDLTMAKSF